MNDIDNIDARAELLYNRVFRKRYSGNDKVFTTHIIKALPNGKDNIKKVIKEALVNYKDVRTGFASTSVRGFYTYYIFYKNR